MNLEFVSSKPGLMEVRREKQSFEANETRQIDLMIPIQVKSSQEQEVMLYINEEGKGRISETLLFKIFVA